MNNKAFTLSIGLAAMAVFMIYSYITSNETEMDQKYGSKVSILVAKKDISEMAEIHENMLESKNIPKQFVEPGKVTDQKEVSGFIASVPIRKGEQITLNKVIAPSVRTGLARQISPGKRAISIPVSDDNAVSRLLKPGDRIDLITTIEPPGGGKGSQIGKIVLQDVPVLAVGEYITTQAPRKLEKDENGGKDFVRNLNIERNYNTITIEVDPQAAMQVLLLKDSSMRMSLMLRNNDDTERVNIPSMTLMDVLGPDSSKVIRTPAAQK